MVRVTRRAQSLPAPGMRYTTTELIIASTTNGLVGTDKPKISAEYRGKDVLHRNSIVAGAKRLLEADKEKWTPRMRRLYYKRVRELVEDGVYETIGNKGHLRLNKRIAKYVLRDVRQLPEHERTPDKCSAVVRKHIQSFSPSTPTPSRSASPASRKRRAHSLGVLPAGDGDDEHEVDRALTPPAKKRRMSANDDVSHMTRAQLEAEVRRSRRQSAPGRIEHENVAVTEDEAEEQGGGEAPAENLQDRLMDVDPDSGEEGDSRVAASPAPPRSLQVHFASSPIQPAISRQNSTAAGPSGLHQQPSFASSSGRRGDAVVFNGRATPAPTDMSPSPGPLDLPPLPPSPEGDPGVAPAVESDEVARLRLRVALLETSLEDARRDNQLQANEADVELQQERTTHAGIQNLLDGRITSLRSALTTIAVSAGVDQEGINWDNYAQASQTLSENVIAAINRKNAAITSLQNRNGQLDDRLDQISDNLTTLQQNHANTVEVAEQLTGQMANVTAQRDQALAQVGQLNTAAAQHQAETAEFQVQITNLDLLVAELQLDNAHLHEQVVHLDTALNDAIQLAEDAQGELHASQEELQASQDELDLLTAEFEDAEEHHTQEVQTLNGTITARDLQITILTQAHHDLETQKNALIVERNAAIGERAEAITQRDAATDNLAASQAALANANADLQRHQVVLTRFREAHALIQQADVIMNGADDDFNANQ